MHEQAVIFPNRAGEKLVGVYHPAASDSPRAAIVMLHGWSGTRCGPHQMLTRAARRFSAGNCATLRFDFAGRGDSEGDTDLATLSTMQEDARAAFVFLRAQTEAPLLVLGLCSGCEIAVASVSSDVAGAILWSAPIFAAPPSQGSASKKRGVNLRKYARKLLSISTYAKVLRGQIDTKGVSKALAGGGGAASKNLESNAPGQLPPGFRRDCLVSWRAFSAPRLQIYGGADPITESSVEFYRQNSGAEAEIILIEGANHSFYGLNWEREVFDHTLDWLDNRFYESV